MQELLMDLWAKRQKTVLFVTHDVDEALRLADVIYVMSAAPEKIIETINVDIERPRSVDQMDTRFIEYRSSILACCAKKNHLQRRRKTSTRKENMI